MTDSTALPPVVDATTWREELDKLRVREKAATRELDAIAAARRRLPMVQMPDYTLMVDTSSELVAGVRTALCDLWDKLTPL